MIKKQVDSIFGNKALNYQCINFLQSIIKYFSPCWPFHY